jgi:hypothetical protein
VPTTKGGEPMGWLLIPLIIIIVIIGVAFVRNRNEQFRFGSGLFKNSEYNLDDQDEFVDKEYYDKDGLLK